VYKKSDSLSSRRIIIASTIISSSPAQLSTTQPHSLSKFNMLFAKTIVLAVLGFGAMTFAAPVEAAEATPAAPATEATQAAEVVNLDE
jgi:hypothetical protein